MASKFGTELVRAGVITPEQLAEALKLQSLYGGRLGTNLVELKFVDIEVMAEWVGRTSGYPVATEQMFAEASDEALELIPPEMCERLECFPLRKDGRRLHVAMVTPNDLAATDALSFKSGLRIVPYAGLELRIFHALEKRYGVKPKNARSVALTSRDDIVKSSGAPPQPPPQAPERPPSQPPPVSPQRAAIDFETAVAELSGAQTREEIGEVLLSFCAGLGEATLLFLVREGMALGWLGQGRELDPAVVEFVMLPLNAPSMFQEANDTRRTVSGRVSDQVLHRHFYKALRRRMPEAAVVAPVVLRSRTVNLIYVELRPGGSAAATALLEAITPHVASAYERIVRGQRSAR